MMAFAIGIKLTDAERKLTSPVCTASVTCLTLGNDYWSWKKEYEQYVQGGSVGEMKNSVFILMKQYNVGPEEAMEICKQLTTDWEHKLLQLKADVESTPQISDNAFRYLDACIFMASGSALWHCSAPRYHGKETKSENSNALTERDSNAVPAIGKKRKFAVDESDLDETPSKRPTVHKPTRVRVRNEQTIPVTPAKVEVVSSKGKGVVSGTNETQFQQRNIYEDVMQLEPNEDVCYPTIMDPLFMHKYLSSSIGCHCSVRVPYIAAVKGRSRSRNAGAKLLVSSASKVV
jgi:hypothetical protein